MANKFIEGLFWPRIYELEDHERVFKRLFWVLGSLGLDLQHGCFAPLPREAVQCEVEASCRSLERLDYVVIVRLLANVSIPLHDFERLLELAGSLRKKQQPADVLDLRGARADLREVATVNLRVEYVRH